MIWYGTGMSGCGYVRMTLSMLRFWSLVIRPIVAPVRYFDGAGWADRGRAIGRPEEIFAERFARGEMDEQEYRRRIAGVPTRRRPDRTTHGSA